VQLYCGVLTVKGNGDGRCSAAGPTCAVCVQCRVREVGFVCKFVLSFCCVRCDGVGVWE